MSFDSALKTKKQMKRLKEATFSLSSIGKGAEFTKSMLKKLANVFYCDAALLYIYKKPGSLKLASFHIGSKNIPTNKLNEGARELPTRHKELVAYSYRRAKTLTINNVDRIEKGAPYGFYGSFDEGASYKTRSVLCFPLINSKGKKLGVVQLCNKKNPNTKIWPRNNQKLLQKMKGFTKGDEILVKGFAPIVTASLEELVFSKDMELLFEGFVRSAVGAIESRDQATRGHSERVAILSVDLAEKVDAANNAGLKKLNFSRREVNELYYASLLHDFGKVCVREKTLNKPSKLFPQQQERVFSRMKEFIHSCEALAWRKLTNDLIRDGRAPNQMDVARVQREVSKLHRELDRRWDTIMELNAPSILDEDKSKELKELKELSYPTIEGGFKKLLGPEEVAMLGIEKGSLSNEERFEIREHVTHSYRFLKEIPWPEPLSNVPSIAYAHHEKMDGSGYPRRIRGEEIPKLSRIMTICDIFDALVARDRPYKHALPVPEALDILALEVKEGKLDKNFFEVFLKARIFENKTFLDMINYTEYHKRVA